MRRHGTGRRARILVLACAALALALAGLALASPVWAAERPALTASRSCVNAGSRVKLTARIPLSYFPPSSPVWGWQPPRATPAPPLRVELLTYRLSAGTWRFVSSQRVSSGDRTTVVAAVAPRRGRYRYVVRVHSWKGVVDSNAAEVAAVGTKVVALTFDDGPWPGSTASILGTLRQKDARATFFMCGYTLAAYPKLGVPVVKDGHEVGNHSWSHAQLTKLSDAGIGRELSSTQDLVKARLGVTPKWCRPPYGATSARVKGVIEDHGMRQVLWDVDPEDWKRPGASVVGDRVVRAVRPGYVVLMHDGGGDRSGTAAALPVIIDRLRAKGYDFVTMSELAALGAGRY